MIDSMAEFYLLDVWVLVEAEDGVRIAIDDL